MIANDRREMIYQVRVPADASPEDVVTVLTQAAWHSLEEGQDPHRWPALHRDFLNVFKSRLRYYPGCGALHTCRGTKDVYKPGLPAGEAHGPTYILILRGGLLSYVEALAALVHRRFRGAFPPADPRRRAIRNRVEGALHRALSGLLFFNEDCTDCRLLAGREERRIWERRDLLPGESPGE